MKQDQHKINTRSTQNKIPSILHGAGELGPRVKQGHRAGGSSLHIATPGWLLGGCIGTDCTNEAYRGNAQKPEDAFWEQDARNNTTSSRKAESPSSFAVLLPLELPEPQIQVISSSFVRWESTYLLHVRARRESRGGVHDGAVVVGHGCWRQGENSARGENSKTGTKLQEKRVF